MTSFEKGGYVEHWEIGIGKITAIESDRLCISFHNKGEMTIPSSQTSYLKKIDPLGFFAHLYEDENQLREKIAEASTDIVKLLIIDNGGEKIERNRIKQLLGKIPVSASGWRKNLCFVLDEEWSQWWSKVSKKIAKDATFDTSIKNEIALNKSQFDPVVKKYYQEKKVDRKLAIAEQVIDKYDVSFGEDIIKKIYTLVLDCLKSTEADQNLLALAVLVLINLKEKHLLLENGIDNEDLYIAQAIIIGELAAKKREKLYKYLASKAQQDIFYHFIIYLYGSDDIKKLVLKSISGLSLSDKESKENGPILHVQKERSFLLRNLSVNKPDELQRAKISLINLYEISIKAKGLNKLLSDIYLGILMAADTPSVLKEIIAQHASDKNINVVMLGYLHNLNKLSSPAIDYIMLFINSLPPDLAVDILSNSVFTIELARLNSNIYESILSKLGSIDVVPGISDAARKKVFSHAYEIIPQDGSEETSSLRIRVAALLEKQNIMGPGSSFSDEDLVDLIARKAAFVAERRNAIALLAARSSKEALKTAGDRLSKQVDEQEWMLLQDILERIKDERFTNKIISELKDKVFQEGQMAQDFLKFIQRAGLLDQLVTALVDASSHGRSEKYDAIERFLQNGDVIKAFVRRVMVEVGGSADSKSKTRDKMAAYYSEAIMAAVDEATTAIINAKVSLEARDRSLRQSQQEDLAKLDKIMEARVADAISKTKQRYQENAVKLKKSIELLDELKRSIDDVVVEEIDKKWIGACTNKIAMVEEDIVFLLKKMGID